MDRRSWLWRRKSSEKSPGETESSGSGSGSISSPSERFSDEHQAYSNQNSQSPEITSKAASHDEDVNDSVKILTQKLSAALANINSKEELVNQHAKVAEEAVTGWEKAENEVITLKQQLDVATKKNSSLEDRVVHLDGALKECLRQLRQVREEQDQKIQEAISKKSQDTESNKKSELESQLYDLRAQLETANAKAEAAASSESDLHLRLESVLKKNESLQLELQSRLEELGIRTLERDLSTKTAESASKQHLVSIKKVAKLEAECRRLKSMARKATSSNEQKSLTFIHSDTWASALIEELDQFKTEKAPANMILPPTTDIGLMDDFLEMEKLAALPVRENPVTSDKLNGIGDASLKAELEAMINKTSELEEKIEMLESGKQELGLTLTRSQDQLKLSEPRLVQLQAQFNECQNQLKISQAQLSDANKKLGMLQAELDLANELRQAIELELEDANVRREETESQLKAIEDESKILLSKVGFLEAEAEKERSLYAEASAKCWALEDELSRMKHEVGTQQSQLALTNNSKKEVESEVKSLLDKVSALENESATKCRKLEDELSRMKHEANTWQSRLASVNGSKEAVELELEMTNARREEAESQLKAAQAEAKSLLDKVGSLELEVEKERALSAEFAAKCRKLENEVSKMKCEADFRLAPLSKEELDLQQEKEIAVAASKLADCQKTIASLGKQLKSLATLDDLFLDPDKLTEISEKESQPLNMNKLMLESDSLASETVEDVKNGKNGFGKLFSRSQNS